LVLLLNSEPWACQIWALSLSYRFSCLNIFSFFFFFCGTWLWIQGFVLSKQVLYCLSHTFSPSASFKLLISWVGTVAHASNPATQEAEIRRISVSGHPGQKVSKTPM
jgi:hypothetical protein